jgi:hypothetical protein
MNKIMLNIVFCAMNLYAGLVNAIAITVNDTPITLVDIDKEMEAQKISKNKAVSILIDKILYEQEIEKHRIHIDIFDVDNYIKKLALNNQMNVLDFKSLVRQQQNYETFKENIRKQLIHQKLISAIAGGKLRIASKEDLQIYYNNHQEQFKIADTIDVVVYISKDRDELTQLKKNPLLQSKKINSQNISMKQSELNAQTKYILNSSEEKKFTAIFAQDKNYNMFFIKKKKNITVLLFENVKDQIFQSIMQEREKDYLKEYFEVLKITADIRILR